MAQLGSTVQFVCRNCRHNLARSTSQIRTFSSTTSKSKSIPTFQPTASPELDALLLDWRQRVFKPAALSANHRSLIYKKSRHVLLVNDPGVTVTMSDGEEIKLEPMEEFDKPNKQRSLVQIANILGSTPAVDSWSQLPAFLEGMKLAHQAVPTSWLEKLTRKANEQGRSSTIKLCAAMSAKTGLSLSNPGITRELFLGCHERAVETKFQGKEFEKECNNAQNLALMLEHEEHCGRTLNPEKGEVDMRKDLLVAGVLLELAAAKAVHVHSGRDVEGAVGNLSQKLIALSGDDILRRDEVTASTRAVECWIPIANGIRLAIRVNDLVIVKGKNSGPDVKSALRARLKQLDDAIRQEAEKVRADAQGKPRRALAMLEKVQQAS